MQGTDLRDTLVGTPEGIVKLFSLLDELSPQKAEKEPFAMYFLQKESETGDLFPTLKKKIHSSTMKLIIPNTPFGTRSRIVHSKDAFSIL
jgi:hypothetical protein